MSAPTSPDPPGSTHANPFDGLSRAEVEACAVGEVELVREKSARMRVLERGGIRAVLKDFSARRWHNRLFWAPLLIRREAATLRQLEGLEGVPRLYAMVDGLGLVVEFIEGTPCNRLREGDLDDAFFRRLTAVVGSIHARGVAHGDLRAASNIIRREDGRPCLVDFATAVRRGPWWRATRNWLFRRLAESDLSGIAKLKATRAPRLLTDEERHDLGHPPLLRRIARAYRALYRRLRRPRWRDGFGPGADE